MCGILGAVVTNPSAYAQEVLFQIFDASSERGKDSWGLSYVKEEKFVHQKSCNFDKPDFSFVRGESPIILIGNRRGEPTSEWVLEKSENNIQPFESPNGSWCITHNGTISNDKQLLKELQIDPPTSIDSYAIGACFDDHGFRYSLTKKLNSGSAFAILALRNDLKILHYAINYKPLYARKFPFGVVFASQKKYLILQRENINNLMCSNPVEILPYTAGMVGKDGGFYNEFSLYPTKGTLKKVLVVCSGGLDSSTVAWMYHKQGHKVELFHLKYNCHAEGEEIKSVRALGEAIGCQVHEVSTNFFSECAPSSLTEDRGINSGKGGEAGAEIATEWVSCRNTVLYALALAFAESHGHNIVALGGNIEESGCVAGGTEVQIRKASNCKRKSIRDLYHLMKGDQSLVPYGMKFDRTIPTEIRTMFPDGTIGYNEIEDIFHSGTKECYRITLEGSKEVISSGEHEWFSNNGWCRADSLQVGDEVYCNGVRYPEMAEQEYTSWRKKLSEAKKSDRNPNRKRENAEKIRRTLNLQRGTEWFCEVEQQWYVTGMSFHPNCTANKKMLKHRLLYEAFLNGISYEDWIAKCRIGLFDGNEVFLDSSLQIHHRDGNHLNNSLDNLEALTSSEHSLRHNEEDPSKGRKSQQGLHELIVDAKRVVSIEYVGLVDTYDIHVRGTSNYVANGIIGHNSYPDNEQEFTNKWNELSPYATKPYCKIEITSPFAAMVKHEIVKIGLELEMPFELTWSCYSKGPKPCWSCGPCYMRRKAFEMNGTVDPLFARYNQNPQDF